MNIENLPLYAYVEPIKLSARTLSSDRVVCACNGTFSFAVPATAGAVRRIEAQADNVDTPSLNGSR